MNHKPVMRTHAMICCIALLAQTLVATSSAAAQPAERSHAVTDVIRTTTTAGPARISLETTNSAIVVGGRFSYRASVTSPATLDFLQVRMRLFMPSGRLIYQKTFVDTSKKPGARNFMFERGTADIGLEPAAYPTELSVRVTSGGKKSEATMKGALIIYDPKARRRPIALVAKVSAVPMADSRGDFVIDPAANVRARDDVIRLSQYALSDRNARLTLSISPLMLEEWRRVARGYRYNSPEGPVEVGAADQTPRTYAYALDQLAHAVSTKRLELLSCGYSDPDLSSLEGAGLISDIGPQYDTGLSSMFGSISATPSAGTAPAGGRFSVRSAAGLVESGIAYAFVSDKAVPDAEPGAYRAAQTGLALLVYDEAQSSALASSSIEAAVASVFNTYLLDEAGPVPIHVSIGRRADSAERLVRLARALSRQPWTQLVLGGAIRRNAGKYPKVTMTPLAEEDPPGTWDSIVEARAQARALTAVLGSEDPDSVSAEKDSLTAEASAWDRADGGPTYSARAREFSEHAEQTAQAVFSKVKVTARPVTLAGTRGKVPITITNGGEKVMTVRVIATPSGAMRKGISPPISLTLQHLDNYIEIPVDLQGALSGRLGVVVMAGDLKIAETTVQLSASVIDRLVILGGIVLILGALLAFIILRVRKHDMSRNGASAKG